MLFFNMIGISGNSRSGKNSLAVCLKEFFNKMGRQTEEVSLAAKLKEEMDPILMKKYGISAFTEDTKEKDVIRDELVKFSGEKRQKTSGRYFIDLINKRVEYLIKEGLIPLLTDLRFIEYARDEYHWLQSNCGLLIYVERIHNGSLVPPANDTERRNNQMIKPRADLRVTWPTIESPEQRYNYVEKTLEDFFLYSPFEDRTLTSKGS